MIESRARAEHSHDPGTRVSGGWVIVAFAGLVGVVLAATSQAANATVVRPAEPLPSVSPRLTAAMQAELMKDVLPASPPITLTDAVTDGAGVLTDAERQDVLDAVDRLADETDLRMFVVYIESFDGTDPVDWANASANQSGLRTDDLLLAIATADGEFGLSADSNVTLTEGQLRQVDGAVTAALEDEQWAPAATDAADTVRQGAGSATSPLLVAGIVLAAVLLLVALGFVLWRFAVPRLRPLLAQLRDRTPVAVAPAAGAFADLTLDELDERAAAALVGIDDALKTSEQELGFARSELGADATRDFELILAGAAGDVREAFAIRQALDVEREGASAGTPVAPAGAVVAAGTAGSDEEGEAGADAAQPEAPESPEDAARRERLARIIALCDAAADTLDARTRAFDDLRRLQQRAAELLADVVTREAELSQRVAATRSLLTQLDRRYPTGPLATIVGNPEQAELLLANAKEAAAAGNSALAAGQKAVAVAHARGAQNALGQAAVLLDAVDATALHLRDAVSRLDKSIASLTQDVASAKAVEGDLRVTLARAAAQASLKHVEVTRQGGDPLAGLQRIATAEAALDAALASVRDNTEVKARASALVRDTLVRVDAQLRQTGDFVATRRGAVGATARTRLAEAVRLADVARTLHPTDPTAALGEAQDASAMVREAARLAREDADAVVAAAAAAEPDAEGTDANGPITGGMMLGGILLDPNLVRSRKRAHTARIGGGFGGGGFGGGRPAAHRKLGTVRAWWPASAR
ncbi:TPM domain-containing protein [Promicromonospora sukumoe]|uniref:TPM domain-containing protein n=1 Tax=Promicromonospora sukumoe TaxID=88382 RepID=UPI0012F939F7|nr:TPM domain-containing protein [Promicromonospora sukumoe]